MPVALAFSFCRAVAEFEDFGIFWLFMIVFGVAILKIAHQITNYIWYRKNLMNLLLSGGGIEYGCVVFYWLLQYLGGIARFV